MMKENEIESGINFEILMQIILRTRKYQNNK